MTAADKYDTDRWDGPSLEVCQARQRAAMDGRCHCGSKKDPIEQPKANGMGRTWIACARCFGTIKQLS